MKWRLAFFALGVAFSTANAQPTREDLLVSPAWLATHLNDANLVLLHVANSENGKRDYAKAHIAGARYLELDDVSVSSMNHTDSLMLEMPTAEKCGRSSPRWAFRTIRASSCTSPPTTSRRARA
jgi:hypothetical protein